jgi:hypothetical protein
MNKNLNQSNQSINSKAFQRLIVNIINHQNDPSLEHFNQHQHYYNHHLFIILFKVSHLDFVFY